MWVYVILHAGILAVKTWLCTQPPQTQFIVCLLTNEDQHKRIQCSFRQSDKYKMYAMSVV